MKVGQLAAPHSMKQQDHFIAAAVVDAQLWEQVAVPLLMAWLLPLHRQKLLQQVVPVGWVSCQLAPETMQG